MDLLTLAVVVVAITSVITLVVLMAGALQLRSTLIRVEDILKSVQEKVNPLIEYEVKPIAESLRRTCEHVEGIARTAKEGADKVGDTVDAVREVGTTVRAINHILDSEVKGSVINLASLIVGVKTGIITLLGARRREKQKEA